MRRIDVTAATVTAALVVFLGLAPGVYASGGSAVISGSLEASLFPPAPAPYVSPMLAMETAALTREGIAPERAALAIGVQSTIAQSGLVRKLETALAGDFAGVWFEAARAQLLVGVTSGASAQVVESVAERAGLAPYLVATHVRFTWAQLLAAQHRWDRKLERLFRQRQAKTSLAPEHNAVTVELGSSVPTSERAALEHEATADGANVVVVVAPSAGLSIAPQANSTACNPFTTGSAFCDKPITSGVTITSSKATCTAGPLAIPKGSTKDKTFLLTAGHCIELGGGIGEFWQSSTRGGSKGKIGTAQTFFNGTKGDYADILVEPGFWTEPNSKDPVFAVMARWGTKNSTKSFPVDGERAPVVGATSCHEGQTSGESCGKITAVEVKVKFTGGPRVDGLVEVEGAKGLAGDSGGPWFFVDTKNALLIEGTHSGELTKGNLAYEPIAFTLSELNLELLTAKNEIRP